MPEKTTIETYLRLWLDIYSKRLSPTTYDGYKVIIEKHLIPALGQQELQKLSPTHIEMYYNDKSKELSGGTLLHHHRLLRKALDYAYRKMQIAKNPVDLVEAPKAKKYHSSVLTHEQVKRLLKEVRNTYLEMPCQIGLVLGLKRGEILGIRWGDINLRKG